jgi:hypothetical protein
MYTSNFEHVYSCLIDDFAPQASQTKKDKRFSLTIFVSGRLQMGQTM